MWVDNSRRLINQTIIAKNVPVRYRTEVVETQYSQPVRTMALDDDDSGGGEQEEEYIPHINDVAYVKKFLCDFGFSKELILYLMSSK